MQKKKTTNMTTAAITAVMMGAAVGMMAKGMFAPKKRKIAKTAGKALDAVGEVMQSVSSYLH
ncbi:MAG: hypothetical protein IJX64_03590 [Clostridia bacterium]|nr:hypothetical protein [Clostridia bacterium]